ncbi:MAG TPA: hypothetical protein VK420_02255 [Longimicrobium sp.]|nr:hypothetical protein [Longimicrobium sp.]
MFRKHVAAAVLVAGLAGTFVACTPDEGVETPTAPAEALSPAAPKPTPTPPAAASSRATAPGQEQAQAARARLTPAQLRENVAWVGKLHTEAMDEATKDEKRLLRVAGGTDRAARCRAVAHLTEKYLGRVQREHGTMKGHGRALASRATRMADPCVGAGALSIMSPAALMQGYTYSPEDGEPVTGAYEPYMAQIQAAVDNAWSSSGAYAAVDQVLASAAGIPEPDLLVLYAQADLALASVSYWYDYEYSGAMDVALRERYGEPMMEQRMYSIFGGMQRSRWRVIGGADVIACAAGVADKWFLTAGGPPGWKILAGACAIYGIGGSAATWLAM